MEFTKPESPLPLLELLLGASGLLTFACFGLILASTIWLVTVRVRGTRRHRANRTSGDIALLLVAPAVVFFRSLCGVVIVLEAFINWTGIGEPQFVLRGEMAICTALVLLGGSCFGIGVLACLLPSRKELSG